MFLIDKLKSIVYRARTSIFKITSQWQHHPLNVPEPVTNWEKIATELASLSLDMGFKLQNFEVNPDDYSEFKKKFWPGALYAVGYKDKKIMEHFLSFKLLSLSPGEVYIDVASENSPYPKIFSDKIGIKAYSQDISYPPGIFGHKIGSSADSMPIDPNSVDKISLHCAFEHFQEEIDTGFIREAARVLKPEGQCLIAPLYLASELLNIVDPILDYHSIQFDESALVIGETNLGGIFERYYSPHSLRRILLPGLGLNYEIFHINIPKSIMAAASPSLARVRYVLRISKAKIP